MRLRIPLGALWVIVLLSSPGVALAQSLQDALAVAYRTNPTIRAERAHLRATEELKAQTWANALPQVHAGAAVTRAEHTQTINAEIFGGVGSVKQSFDLTTKSAGVEGEYAVFTGFRNYNAIRQARARIRAGGAQLAATEQAVLLEVATAYFDVLRDMTVFESSRNNVEVLLRQHEEAEVRFRVGEVTRTDVSQAEARLAGARANLSAAQARLAMSRAAYKELVGDAPGTLDSDTPLPALPDNEEAAQALANAYAPNIIAALEIEQASRRQIAIAKGEFLPTISLTAGYQYADEPSTFIQNDEQFSYGVRATVPLFNGGLRLSRVREARALAERAAADVESARRRAGAQVTSAWHQTLAARATIAAASRQVEANTLALQGVRREAQLGVRTTLDVLDAEQEYFNSVVSLASARRDEYVAAFALLAATGLLTLEAIGADPDAVIPRSD